MVHAGGRWPGQSGLEGLVSVWLVYGSLSDLLSEPLGPGLEGLCFQWDARGVGHE